MDKFFPAPDESGGGAHATPTTPPPAHLAPQTTPASAHMIRELLVDHGVIVGQHVVISGDTHASGLFFPALMTTDLSLLATTATLLLQYVAILPHIDVLVGLGADGAILAHALAIAVQNGKMQQVPPRVCYLTPTDQGFALAAPYRTLLQGQRALIATSVLDLPVIITEARATLAAAGAQAIGTLAICGDQQLKTTAEFGKVWVASEAPRLFPVDSDGYCELCHKRVPMHRADKTSFDWVLGQLLMRDNDYPAI